MKKVFLGGTCNGSFWRDELIRDLKMDYFQPMSDQWTPAMMDEEIRQREECDYCLYVITPKMEGFYSIAELVDDSNKRPEKTIFCFLENDGEHSFTPHQVKSLETTATLIKNNGASFFKSLADVAIFLNNQ